MVKLGPFHSFYRASYQPKDSVEDILNPFYLDVRQARESFCSLRINNKWVTNRRWITDLSTLHQTIFPAIALQSKSFEQHTADYFERHHRLTDTIPLNATVMRLFPGIRQKKEPKWEGPFKVIALNPTGSYCLQRPDNSLFPKVPRAHLKVIALDTDFTTSESPTSRIVSHSGPPNQRIYQVILKNGKHASTPFHHSAALLFNQYEDTLNKVEPPAPEPPETAPSTENTPTAEPIVESPSREPFIESPSITTKAPPPKPSLDPSTFIRSLPANLLRRGSVENWFLF